MFHVSNQYNYFVYMHVFPNNKVYIGITSQNSPEDRWLNGFGYKPQMRMWRAIQKYGWANIEHIIIARNVNIDTAVNMEKELINMYDAANKKHGYNVSPGGWAMGEESRKKLSQSATGRIMKEDTKKKISDAFKGRKPSEKAIEKLKEYNRTRDYNDMVQPNETPVLQFDVITSRFIKEYRSINKAAKSCFADPRNIKCCTDEHVCQYRGYLWIYKSKASEEYILSRLANAQNPSREFPIVVENCCSKKMEYYKNIKEFSEKSGYKVGSIIAAIRKNRLFDKQYKIYAISIPEYVEKTNKRYSG